MNNMATYVDNPKESTLYQKDYVNLAMLLDPKSER